MKTVSSFLGRGALAVALLVAANAPLNAQPRQTWPAIEAAARGQSVYFNAWAGDPAINRYLGWAAQAVEARYDVRLIHVKVADIATVVSRILAEQAAGRREGGSVDLLWINGENYASLMKAGVLQGPWTATLPSAAAIDAREPSIATDFTLPTAGFELAWGGARFTLFYESHAVRSPPPQDPAALLQWIEAHPGRFTYPQPPDFLGSSFLKQLLLLLTPNRERLQRPVAADFDQVTKPLWTWLETARPRLWRGGRVYPRSGQEQRRLLGDGEVDWSIAFNPSEANRAILDGELPDSIRALHFRGGALANSHFLAIPVNARAREGALLVANFLLSPEAQARKADEAIWGDPTVLAVDRLALADQQRFAGLKRGPAWPREYGLRLSEPHPSWTTALERAWIERYGAQ